MLQKRLAFLGLLIFSTLLLHAQVLFTIGEEPVTEAEFKKAFLKNNPTGTNNRAAMLDYLPAYINYKLKIKAAYAAGIDTLPMQKAEAAQFRNMIAAPYLVDQKKLAELVNEAKLRASMELLVAQAFVPKNDKTGKPVVILNNKNFADSVFVKHAVTMGWITAFSLPYKLESILYKLKDGSLSEPIATEEGWYVFKRIQTRPASGNITVAHILVAFPPEPTKEDSLQALQKATSIYQDLLHGASFLELAKSSDDGSTSNIGGILPPFTIGTKDANFETAAFALAKDEAISKPVLTSFGYHILKRLKRAHYATLQASPDYDAAIRSKVLEDSRIQTAKDALIQLVYQTAGSKILVNTASLFAFTEENLFSETPAAAHGTTIETPVLATGLTQTLAGEWLRYANMMQLKAVHDGKDLIPYAALFDAFEGYIALQVYQDRLEDFQPEFAAVYKEFKEGNMLFEMMQQEVWSKAAKDQAGLNRFYQLNKSKYGADYNAAIGEIITDYQQELEAVWLDTLRLLYPVKLLKAL